LRNDCKRDWVRVWREKQRTGSCEEAPSGDDGTIQRPGDV
jgi:hypothetical protein